MKIRKVKDRADTVEIVDRDGRLMVQASGGYAARMLRFFEANAIDDEGIAAAFALGASYGLLHQSCREAEAINQPISRGPSPEDIEQNLRRAGAL